MLSVLSKRVKEMGSRQLLTTSPPLLPHWSSSTMIAQDGDRFWKIPECYVRGNSIKYLRVPEEVIDMVNEEDLERERAYAMGWGLSNTSFALFSIVVHTASKAR